MFGYARLTLKKRPKVKFDHTKRFPAYDFLHVGLPFETSRTNNKRVISTFNPFATEGALFWGTVATGRHITSETPIK